MKINLKCSKFSTPSQSFKKTVTNISISTEKINITWWTLPELVPTPRMGGAIPVFLLHAIRGLHMANFTFLPFYCWAEAEYPVRMEEYSMMLCNWMNVTIPFYFVTSRLSCNTKQKPARLAMVCQCIRFDHSHLISYELTTEKKNVKVHFAV